MANTGKDADGATIFLRAPFGTGVDDTNAYVFGSSSYFQRNGNPQLLTLDTTTPANNRPMPVVLLSGDSAAPFSSTNPVPVSSTGYQSVATITRPANVTAYSANDCVGGVITFTNIGPSGGFILINSIRMVLSITAVPTGMATTNFIVYLYDASPPSNVADNAVLTLPAGDRASILTPQGISMGSPTLFPGGGSVVLQANNLGLQVKLANGSTSLFAYLQTSVAYTPAANSEVYTMSMQAMGI